MKTESNIDKREIEIEKLKKYKYGFSTDIENTRAPKGLSEEVIRFISNIKEEPDWMPGTLQRRGLLPQSRVTTAVTTWPCSGAGLAEHTCAEGVCREGGVDMEGRMANRTRSCSQTSTVTLFVSDDTPCSQVRRENMCWPLGQRLGV